MYSTIALLIVSLNARYTSAQETLSKADINKTITGDKIIQNQNFNITILVEQTPKEVFNAINNVCGWWSEEIEGSADKLNAEFLYHYKDVHICKMKIVEFIPNEKVVWLVLDNHFSFTKDETEWKGTKISFEISKKENQTQLVFTHIGLVSEYECYDVCREGWTNYINNSLYSLITSGKGSPILKKVKALIPD